MSPYIVESETASAMARALRPLRNFDVRGLADLAATQAGFTRHEINRHLTAAIEIERARRTAFPQIPRVNVMQDIAGTVALFGGGACLAFLGCILDAETAEARMLEVVDWPPRDSIDAGFWFFYAAMFAVGAWALVGILAKRKA